MHCCTPSTSAWPALPCPGLAWLPSGCICINAAHCYCCYAISDADKGNTEGNTKHSSLKTILVDTKRRVASVSHSSQTKAKPRSGRQAHKTQQIHDKREIRKRGKNALNFRSSRTRKDGSGCSSGSACRLRVLLTRHTSQAEAEVKAKRMAPKQGNCRPTDSKTRIMAAQPYFSDFNEATAPSSLPSRRSAMRTRSAASMAKHLSQDAPLECVLSTIYTHYTIGLRSVMAWAKWKLCVSRNDRIKNAKLPNQHKQLNRC